ncbi:MAG: SDR family oxidoreductase [Deltaproteobacteria bacterium]|nr:SDR family oxidoreductase [Deltaproteobacteria bacterium]
MTDTQTRVLILGGSGMLGHKLWLVFKNRFDTYVTLRQPLEKQANLNLFDPARTFDNIDVKNTDSLTEVLQKIRPTVMINCIGVVKQLPEAKDPIISIKINSLLPHELEKLAIKFGTKLIHISTDCIFEGGKGNYTEEEPYRADDLYGLTKLLGEVSNPPSLTLRTSIIGRELVRQMGLLEWFLQRKPGEQVKGFTHALFSGFTTQVLAETLAWIIQSHRHLTGIYHLSSFPISKHDLLKKLQKVFNLDIDLIPFDDFHCDRSLNGSRFNIATGFVPPSWDQMVQGLKAEDSFYREISHAAGR